MDTGCCREGRIIYVPVTLADEEGRVESNADELLSAEVSGGELLGFGSANPRTVDDFTSGQYTSYYGCALAVVRIEEGREAVIRVRSASGKYAEKVLKA